MIRLFEKWNEDIRIGRSIYIRQFDNYIGILKGYEPEACDQRELLWDSVRDRSRWKCISM